jgi:hypothetical protein
MLTRLLATGALVLAATSSARADAFDHVFLIMMENHATGQIIGNTVDAPFINRLAPGAHVALNYYGVTHPSLPEYLALLSGSFQGIWDDCRAGPAVTCAPEEFVPGAGDATDGNYLSPQQVASASAQPHWFTSQTLVDQLVARGLDWKAYMQSMPAGGHDLEYAPTVNGKTVKLYAQKHNPFEYFAQLHGDARIVPFEGTFAADLAADRVPAFVWISPDQCHDMHGVSAESAALLGLPSCGYPSAGMDHGAIALGDRFLETTVAQIRASKAWQQHRSAIVIVWDEDDYSGFAGCCGSPVGNGYVLGGSRTPAIVVTSDGRRGGVTFKAANHYSMLGTLQRLWDLPCLAETCRLGRRDLLLEMFGEGEDN